jgi:hypothetical protein
MKKLVVLAVLLGFAAAIGYLLGTEKGRAQQEQITAKLRDAQHKASEAAAHAVERAKAATGKAAGAVEDAAEAVETAVAN